MLLQRYSPTQAGAIVGVSASTIRAWCKEFGEKLSESANPAPGIDRTLLASDVAQLQKVKELRAVGLSVADILQALSDVPTEELQPYVDSQVTKASIQPATPTESPQQGAFALQVASLVNEQLATMQARLDATVNERMRAIEEQQTRAVSMFLLGLLAGLLLAIVGGLIFIIGARLGG